MDKVVQKSSILFLLIGALFGCFIGLNANAYADKPEQPKYTNNTGCSRVILEGYYKHLHKLSTPYVKPDKKQIAINRMLRA